MKLYWTFCCILFCCYIHIREAERDIGVEEDIPTPAQGNSFAQLRHVQVGIEKRRWNQAVAEAGLDPASVSDFGRAVPKFSASIVNALADLRALGKKHRFNFQGRLMGNLAFSRGEAEWHRRHWTIEFARANFSDQDFFMATDAKQKLYHWQPMGFFDRSLEDTKPLAVIGPLSRRHNSQEHQEHAIPANSALSEIASVALVDTSLYDVPYYAEMAASNFTLCPGGDTTWSMRAYESALTGAICLIKDPREDWNPATSKAYTPQGLVHLEKLFSMYKFVRLDDPLEFSQETADENLRTFIKYQTFIEGDNVPA